MSATMNLEEAKKYAEQMTYTEAVHNAMRAKCVPYRKATMIKIKELLEIAKKVDARSGYVDTTCEELTKPVTTIVYPESPCDLCRFNPPSAGDGKPCTMCPAEGMVEE